tara:strand:- start:40473 stop:41099 length:627 start_codon:yes stop_codon:yes gene_type:complete
MGYEKINEPIICPDVLDYSGAPISGGGGAPTAGLLLPTVSNNAAISVEQSTYGIRKAEYDLAGFTLDILATEGTGGKLLLSCPATGGKFILGGKLIVTDATLTGDWSQANPAVTLAVGSALTTGTSITGTEENIISELAMGGTNQVNRTYSRRVSEQSNPVTLIETKRSDNWYVNADSAHITALGTATITVVAGSFTVYYMEVEDITL